MRMEQLKTLVKNMEKKESLRNIIKQQRDKLSKELVKKDSKLICDKLLELKKYDSFLVYSAINNEVDLVYFANEAVLAGKKIAYPRVNGSQMDFYLINSLADLSEGYFHIKEPTESCPVFYPNRNTLCLVPGLVFSEQGDRIGYGKGFYDKYFNRYSDIAKIGVAFDFQICPKWEPDSFDVSMDALITEKREVFINDKIRRNM